MNTPFESDSILVEPDAIYFVTRILEFFFPPSHRTLSQEPDIWARFEVPQYRDDDPARPLGYYESGAKLVR